MPLIYCHFSEVPLKPLQAVSWVRPGLSGESEHSFSVGFSGLEAFSGIYSQAPEVNQKHKGYDVQYV